MWQTLGWALTANCIETIIQYVEIIFMESNHFSWNENMTQSY